MQSTVLMYARKPLPHPAFQPTRRTRRSLLAQLRDHIEIMRMIGFDHVTIGRTLRITPDDVRALSPRMNQQNATRRLKRHAIDALLDGKHADLGGTTCARRAKNLLKIAVAYTWEELLQEPGVGTVTATEIRLWLEERGATLRPSG